MPNLSNFDLPAICRQRLHGCSNRSIAASFSISRNSVNTIFKEIEIAGYTVAEVAAMSTAEALAAFGQDKKASRNEEYYMPDFKKVAQYVARPGHTVQMAWVKYCSQCREQDKKAYQITQFRYYLDEFLKDKAYSYVITYKAGERIETDWAGTKTQWRDPLTGETVYGCLFVAVLSFSGYAFAWCTPDMKMDSWIQAHILMFNYFGGSAVNLICDNLKTGVLKNANNEIKIHPIYKDMARHYSTAVVATRIYSPKDKAKVENTVGKLTRFIIHEMEERTFFSIDEYNEAVLEKLDEFNKLPFQKKDGSRYSLFTDFEKDTLKPLPPYPYALVDWKKAKVYKNSHVYYQYNYYSVPTRYVGKTVTLKAGAGKLTISIDDVEIAVHKLFPKNTKGNYSSIREHFPEHYDRYSSWSKVKYVEMSKEKGPNVYRLISKLFQGEESEQQKYKSASDVLMLGKKYGDIRLNSACGIALDQNISPTYYHVKAILEKREDLQPVAVSEEPIKEEPVNPDSFYRGGSYFAKKK